jgi:hypothetical protein
VLPSDINKNVRQPVNTNEDAVKESGAVAPVRTAITTTPTLLPSYTTKKSLLFCKLNFLNIRNHP